MGEIYKQPLNAYDNRIYSSIDSARIFAAFSVVIIHTCMRRGIFNYIVWLQYYAVPLFFIISGFFMGKNIEKPEKIKKTLLSMLRLCVECMAGYVIANIFISILIDKSYLNTVNFRSILRFFIFNEWPFKVGGPVWYLHACVYAYLIIYLLAKKKLLIKLGGGISHINIDYKLCCW